MLTNILGRLLTTSTSKSLGTPRFVHLVALLVVRFPWDGVSDYNFCFQGLEAERVRSKDRIPFTPFDTLQYHPRCAVLTESVDRIVSPAFVVLNQRNVQDTCYTENLNDLSGHTFTQVPTKFLLRDRWGNADLLTDYKNYGFTKSNFDTASNKRKEVMIEDLLFKKVRTSSILVTRAPVEGSDNEEEEEVEVEEDEGDD